MRVLLNTSNFGTWDMARTKTGTVYYLFSLVRGMREVDSRSARGKTPLWWRGELIYRCRLSMSRPCRGMWCVLSVLNGATCPPVRLKKTKSSASAGFVAQILSKAMVCGTRNRTSFWEAVQLFGGFQPGDPDRKVLIGSPLVQHPDSSRYG